MDMKTKNDADALPENDFPTIQILVEEGFVQDVSLLRGKISHNIAVVVKTKDLMTNNARKGHGKFAPIWNTMLRANTEIRREYRAHCAFAGILWSGEKSVTCRTSKEFDSLETLEQELRNAAEKNSLHHALPDYERIYAIAAMIEITEHIDIAGKVFTHEGMQDDYIHFGHIEDNEAEALELDLAYYIAEKAIA
jgi:hypothetical protein